MGLRETREKPAIWSRYAITVLVALILPLTLNALRISEGASFGEGLASIGAILNIPDAGLTVLLEDLRDSIYAEDIARRTVRIPMAQTPTGSEPEIPAERPSSPGPAKITGRPQIPPEHRGTILAENFSGREDASNISIGSGLLFNYTKLKNAEIPNILKTPMPLSFEDNGQPLVLIYHTHATESFERFDADVYDTRNTWRSYDNNYNVVALGAVMAMTLEEHGIAVIHDTTQHDNPSYNSSYARSAKTVENYLKEYPSIKIVLDVHRDAMERDNNVIVKPVANIGGENAAQVMIIAGCDDGTMNMPGWRDNLRFASAYQEAMEKRYPGLTRPVLFTYRKYNQDLSPGALLVEFGSNANALDEALYSARLAGSALADLIMENY